MEPQLHKPNRLPGLGRHMGESWEIRRAVMGDSWGIILGRASLRWAS